MSVQIPLFEKTGSKASKVGSRVDEIVGDGFDVNKFMVNFAVLAQADGGVTSLRQLALHLAFQGRFTGERRPLVPAVVRGTHKALTVSKGREATTTSVRGGSALAVGSADMLIPAGWDWLPLVSVARLESGHTPSRNHADYWDGGIPWIGIRDAKNHNYGWIDATEQTVSAKGLANSSARLLPAGTVCLSRTASVGYVTIMKRSMATSQDFVNWVCGERLLPEYLMQLLRCEVPVLKRFSKGAVHQTIYFPEVKAFHISVPPLAEQKRIVAKVDQLMALCDDLEVRLTKKRETGTRLTKSALEALATAVEPQEFDAAWKRVVDNFDVLIDRAEKVATLRGSILGLAVTGRLVPSRDDAEPVGVVLRRREQPARARATVRELKAPWSGALHQSWTVTYAEHLCSLITDGDHNPPARTPAGIPHLTAKNVRKGGIDFTGCTYVSTESYAKSRRRYEPQRGDVLLTCVGTLGRTAVVADEVFSADRNLAVLRPIPEVLDPEYLRLLLNGPAMQTVIASASGATAQPHIYLDDIRGLVCPVPPIPEQKAIVAKVEHLMKVCDDLEARLGRAEDRAAKLVEAVVQELVSDA